MAVSEEQVKEAKLLGWSPKESWRGDPSHWVDADVFVERGRTVLPIVKENNERLTQTVNAQQGEINRLSTLVEEGRASMEEFKKFHGEELRRQVDKTKRDLRVEIEQARKDGDVETAVDLQERLDELTESTRDMGKGETGGGGEGKREEGKKPLSSTNPTDHPDFVAWKASNSWYGPDPIKTSIANGVAVKLRQDGNTLLGKAFFDAVGEGVEAILNPPKPGASKVEGGGSNGGGGGASGGGGSSRGFDGLPSEAQGYARSVAKKYVGEGKMFKTENDWFKYYADHYEV